MKNISRKILASGEILFDCFPDFRRPGGAPANFIIGVSQFGFDARLFSAVGNDSDGDELLNLFRDNGGDTALVQRSPNPTGKVEVTIHNAIPSYDIKENSAWDDLHADVKTLEFAGSCDAAVFGSLAGRGEVSRRAITEVMRAVPAKSLRIFDINLRQNYYSFELLDQFLQLANVLKISEEELSDASSCLNLPEKPDQFASGIMKKYHLQMLLLSLGKNGSRLYDRCGSYAAPAEPPPGGKVVSTVGAGDAFLAGFTGALLSGADPVKAQKAGNLFAAFVCSQEGAWVKIPAELLKKFQE